MKVVIQRSLDSSVEVLNDINIQGDSLQIRI